MKLSLTLFLYLWSNLTFGANLNQVNILTWWGYLDNPWVSQYIQEKCNTKISFDEYYTNEDFLRRIKQPTSDYDVVIFAETIYNLVKNEIANKGDDLSGFTSEYYPIIKDHYLQSKYPTNIVYFLHSITGFLWNSDLVSVNNTDSLDQILTKANNKIIVMIDDPVEISLITQNFTQNAYLRFFRYRKIKISNQLNPFYGNNDFGLAYIWSGQAFFNNATKHHLHFSINPSYSYFSSDLIAALNKSTVTACVSKVLASKEFLNKLQSSTSYLSPYGDLSRFTNEDAKIMYNHLLKNFSKFKWLQALDKEDFYNINQRWNFIKLDILNLENEN